MRQSYKINPKINFYKVESYLKERCFSDSCVIRSNGVYALVRKLTDNTRYSSKDKYEKRWEDFYLPLKRSGREISIPFSIVKYKNVFYCYFFRLGKLEIKRENNETDQIFHLIFQETIRFIQLLKRTEENIAEKTVPYDFRIGKILGKYILDTVIAQKEKQQILKSYNYHLQKKLETKECSLNKYLHVAGLCYKAVFGKETANLSSLQMYTRWADKRDGGMLSIKKWDSKKSFLRWYKSGKWTGSHPFEIVFSWHRHGIHLYPPSSQNLWQYCLRVTNYAYAMAFIKMSSALIKNEIPFIAYNFGEVLSYLAGETYFTVNDYSDTSFIYIPSQEHKRKYFKHIEWDKLKLLK